MTQKGEPSGPKHDDVLVASRAVDTAHASYTYFRPVLISSCL